MFVFLCSIGGVHYAQGQYDDALATWQDMLQVREKTLGLEHPLAADTKNNIALIYQNQAKYPEALQMHQEVLGVRLKIFGPDHPDTAVTKNKCASLLFAKTPVFSVLSHWQSLLLCVQHGDHKCTARQSCRCTDHVGGHASGPSQDAWPGTPARGHHLHEVRIPLLLLGLPSFCSVTPYTVVVQHWKCAH